MIFGVHNIVDPVAHYWKEHLSSDGAMWILGLDGLLLVPVIFAMFFYPMAVLIGVALALALTAVCLVYLRLVRAFQTHRHTTSA